MRALLIPAAIALLVDQASKLAMLKLLDLPNRGEIDVLPPLLNFRMAWNRGINFGLFGSNLEVMRWVLTGLAVAISVAVFLWLRRSKNRLQLVAGGLLIGGAIGNAIDRVIHGAVVDFLNMSCCGIENPYAFNLADVAIFAGAIGLILAGEKAAAKKR